MTDCLQEFNKIGLTKKQKQALSMWYFDGLTQDEIAEKMGITTRSVERLLEKGRKKIKKSGNSLKRRFCTKTRPKLLNFDDIDEQGEDKIIEWF
jgi:predicted DNA-binding protein YlxM (UPF0122 family)